MTCVLGYKTENSIIMAAESASICECSLDKKIRIDEKLFVRDNMIFAFSGSWRMGQILKYSLFIPNQPKGMSDHEYMCSLFVDEVILVFEEKKFGTIDNNEVSGGFFLVGYNGNIYVIESDFQVGVENTPYHAMGCGESFSLGCLHALEGTHMSPKDKLTKALDAACKFSAGCQAPYTYAELPSSEWKKISGKKRKKLCKSCKTKKKTKKKSVEQDQDVVKIESKVKTNKRKYKRNSTCQ